jgi:hypothetical protein
MIPIRPCPLNTCSLCNKKAIAFSTPVGKENTIAHFSHGIGADRPIG